MKTTRKLKRRIKQAPVNWLKRLWRKVKKDPLDSLIWMILGPILVYYIAQIVLVFSALATVGYIAACVLGLSKILDKPNRIIVWAGGYILGTIVVRLFFSIFLPKISLETSTDIFASIVILYVVLVLWIKGRELRKR